MLARDVRPHGAPDATHVDTAVLVEALVLDGDDRLLHERADLVPGDEDPALRASQRRENRVVVARIDVPVDLAVDPGRITARDLLRDRRDHPERERREAEEREDQEDEEEPKLADLATGSVPGRLGLPFAAEQAADCSTAVRSC